MELLYSMLVTLAAALAAPWYLVRYGLRGWPRGYWRERLGVLPESFREPPEAGTIWIHAVSVGETLAVAGFASEIMRRFPSRPVYLSHVTPTGRAAGEGRIPGVAGRFYLPLDWKWAARRTFERLRPALLIVAETEIWPNLFSVARERGTHVLLVNARLSQRSWRGYRRFGFFFRRALGGIDYVFAQTERDAARFRELGVPPARVTVAGNLKFDGKPPQLGELPQQLRRALQAAGRGPLLVAGSTMAGEEGLVLRAWDIIRARFPRAFVILAPRHPQRFHEVANLLGSEGRRFVRRNSLNLSDLDRHLAGAEALLLDTIGELASVYALADAAFVGGSLVGSGGHNLLEPAFCAKPVLFGPHMENFRDAADQFLTSAAAFQVEDAEELADRIIELFADPRLREAMGSRARDVVQASGGATERILSRLGEWLVETPAFEAAAERQAR